MTPAARAPLFDGRPSYAILSAPRQVAAAIKREILQGELKSVGAQTGPASNELFDLRRPDLQWTKLAEGMGVEAARVDNMARFADTFRAACSKRGPFLIEYVI